MHETLLERSNYMPTTPLPLRPAHNIFAPFGPYPLAPLAPPDLKELETTAKQATTIHEHRKWKKSHRSRYIYETISNNDF